MATKKKLADSKPEKREAAPAVATVASQSDDEKKQEQSKRIAGLLVSSSFNAACIQRTIATGAHGREISVVDIHDKLVEKIDAVAGGDMSGPERMLMTQACTLDLLFHDLILKARSADMMPKLGAYMRMALKAQQQSATTLKILGEIKSPRQVAFIKQQNNAHQQQVNNRTAPPTRAREEKTVTSNELLEHQNGEWLDAGTTSKAGRGDQEMETVGAVDRTSNAQR